MNIKKVLKRILPNNILYNRMYNLELRKKDRYYIDAERELQSEFQSVFGRSINWDAPTTYNEKINVSKLYNSTPLKTQLADKILVVDWAKNRLGKECCDFIPLLGV